MSNFKTKQKIHFINRIDNSNIGDILSSPLFYFSNFFCQYYIVRHDICSINWTKIFEDDIVIIGGGGLIDILDEWNISINKLFDIGMPIIGWGIGFNTHYDINNPKFSLNVNRFHLIGIRDFGHLSNLLWLPCVSALHPSLKIKQNIKRRIGIIEHKDYPILDVKLLNYEKINNSANIQTIINFIASSQIIVTSTYHITYWAQLMCKKVIVVNPFSSKFEYFKYKPVFYSGNLESDIDKAKINNDFYVEAMELNCFFFKQVKEYIQLKIERKINWFKIPFNKIKIIFWKKENNLIKATELLRVIYRNIQKILNKR